MNEISFKNWYAMSDQELIADIGAFVRYHRLANNKSQEQLAHEAGISRSTLSLLERGESVTLDTLIRLLRVLDQLYVLEVFDVQEEISPLELAKAEQKQRIRAQKTIKTDSLDSDW